MWVVIPPHWAMVLDWILKVGRANHQHSFPPISSPWTPCEQLPHAPQHHAFPTTVMDCVLKPRVQIIFKLVLSAILPQQQEKELMQSLSWEGRNGHMNRGGGGAALVRGEGALFLGVLSVWQTTLTSDPHENQGRLRYECGEVDMCWNKWLKSQGWNVCLLFYLFCESLCCFLLFIPFIGERGKSWIQSWPTGALWRHDRADYHQEIKNTTPLHPCIGHVFSMTECQEISQSNTRP